MANISYDTYQHNDLRSSVRSTTYAPYSTSRNTDSCSGRYPFSEPERRSYEAYDEESDFNYDSDSSSDSEPFFEQPASQNRDDGNRSQLINLYKGSDQYVAEWHAILKSKFPKVKHFREFAARYHQAFIPYPAFEKIARYQVNKICKDGRPLGKYKDGISHVETPLRVVSLPGDLEVGSRRYQKGQQQPEVQNEVFTQGGRRVPPRTSFISLAHAIKVKPKVESKSMSFTDRYLYYPESLNKIQHSQDSQAGRGSMSMEDAHQLYQGGLEESNASSQSARNRTESTMGERRHSYASPGYRGEYRQTSEKLRSFSMSEVPSTSFYENSYRLGEIKKSDSLPVRGIPSSYETSSMGGYSGQITESIETISMRHKNRLWPVERETERPLSFSESPFSSRRSMYEVETPAQKSYLDPAQEKQWLYSVPAAYSGFARQIPGSIPRASYAPDSSSVYQNRLRPIKRERRPLSMVELSMTAYNESPYPNEAPRASSMVEISSYYQSYNIPRPSSAYEAESLHSRSQTRNSFQPQTSTPQEADVQRIREERDSSQDMRHSSVTSQQSSRPLSSYGTSYAGQYTEWDLKQLQPNSTPKQSKGLKRFIMKLSNF